ncbi:MAG: FliM/FliN family flagellar motor switch protein [Myxococcales bacterium]|jgi:type III secretion protein Q
MNRLSPSPLDPSLLRPFTPALCALQRSPAVRDAGAESLRQIAAALEAQLGSPFVANARLLETRVDTRRLPSGCCYVVLSLSNTGEYGLIEIEEGLVAALVDMLAGGSGAAFAPGSLTNAEVASLSFLTLCALRVARGVPVIEEALAARFSCVARTPPEVEAILTLEPDWCGIDFSLSSGALGGSGRLLLPSRTLVRLSGTHEAAFLPLPAELLPFTLPASLLAGSADIEAHDLARLSVGDALLLSGLERGDEGVCGAARLAFDGFHLSGELAARSFTYASFTDAAVPPEVLMPADVPPPLPIQIEVELARVRVPLSQLGQLQPGAVLGLDMSLTDPVVLMVGEKPFAKAELVDIGGEVGARIIALLS